MAASLRRRRQSHHLLRKLPEQGWPGPRQPLACEGVDLLSVDPATIVAILGLGGAGVSALWKIAGGLGKFEAKTSTILNAMQVMLQDHEERIRVMERKR